LASQRECKQVVRWDVITQLADPLLAMMEWLARFGRVWRRRRGNLDSV